MTGAGHREWRMVVFPAHPGTGPGGNPAGVVFDPIEEDDQAMVRTAVRLNPVSETAFVWPPDQGAHGIRYFAPGGEVALCGHATAAAYGALALAGGLGPLPARVRSVAPGGEVRGSVQAEGDGLVVWLDMPVARRIEAALDLDALAHALGLPPPVLASRPPAAIEDVGIRIAVVPVAHLAALDAMRPDFAALNELGGEHGIIAFYPFVLDPDTPRVRARGFAPAVGIDEDPATGTAAAALGAFLAREGLVPGDVDLPIRQGEAMGSPSELRLRVRQEGGAIRSVQVGGWVRGEPVGE